MISQIIPLVLKTIRRRRILAILKVLLISFVYVFHAVVDIFSVLNVRMYACGRRCRAPTQPPSSSPSCRPFCHTAGRVSLAHHRHGHHTNGRLQHTQRLPRGGGDGELGFGEPACHGA